jgi:hypothetical protein
VVHDAGPGWMIGQMYGDQDVEYVQLYELRAGVRE